MSPFTEGLKGLWGTDIDAKLKFYPEAVNQIRFTDAQYKMWGTYLGNTSEDNIGIQANSELQIWCVTKRQWSHSENSINKAFLPHGKDVIILISSAYTHWSSISTLETRDRLRRIQKQRTEKCHVQYKTAGINFYPEDRVMRLPCNKHWVLFRLLSMLTIYSGLTLVHLQYIAMSRFLFKKTHWI